jgi:hypothetical protein
MVELDGTVRPHVTFNNPFDYFALLVLVLHSLVTMVMVVDTAKDIKEKKWTGYRPLSAFLLSFSSLWQVTQYVYVYSNSHPIIHWLYIFVGYATITVSVASLFDFLAVVEIDPTYKEKLAYRKKIWIGIAMFLISPQVITIPYVGSIAPSILPSLQLYGRLGYGLISTVFEQVLVVLITMRIYRFAMKGFELSYSSAPNTHGTQDRQLAPPTSETGRTSKTEETKTEKHPPVNYKQAKARFRLLSAATISIFVLRWICLATWFPGLLLFRDRLPSLAAVGTTLGAVHIVSGK